MCHSPMRIQNQAEKQTNPKKKIGPKNNVGSVTTKTVEHTHNTERNKNALQCRQPKHPQKDHHGNNPQPKPKHQIIIPQLNL